MGVSVRVLLRVLLCPPGGARGQSLGLTPSVRDSTWSLHPDTHSSSRDPTLRECAEVWVWRAAAEGHDADGNRTGDVEPFADLTTNSVQLQGKPVGTLAAPCLLNDYYTNLLQCSCDGVVALALGSSVFLWNSETRALLGHLDPNPPGGRPRGHSQSICSLCWSRDGRTLSIGTRRGQIQLFDVEHDKNVSCLPFHQSAVRALSWKQQILSSGSDLGHIHHHDPRGPTLLAGAAVQQGGVCSLQWSPTDDRLASGSTDGSLHVWDDGITSSQRPIITMNQPSSVKAMGWCPWQRDMIATGGGWMDGQLRIWDVQSGAGVTSVNTDSQWAEKNRRLLTGHGLPNHHITCWSWTGPGLRLHYQLTGHSHRVLHVALNPDGSQMFSAGADQVFHMWDVSPSVCL